MGKQVIPYTTKEQWLEARTHDVTSTESAALFNASPYQTAFELFHAKRDGIVEWRADNARMLWGRRLQNPIAQGVAEDQGIEVRAMTEYIRDPDIRIGSSFDFAIVSATTPAYMDKLAERGPGIMEIKAVDPFVFKDEWQIVDGEVIEAPPHIELQVQHQMLTAEAQWALIVALVGGNRVSIIERDYDPVIGKAIAMKVRDFWDMVETNTPPSPDYTRDAETIARLYLETTAGKTLDAGQDHELFMAAEVWHEYGTEIRLMQEQRDAMRARILERIGDAARVTLPNGATLNARTVRETMVPEFMRSAYRTIKFSPRKEIK